MKNNVEYFSKYLRMLDSHKLYPTIHSPTGPSYTPRVILNGTTFLSFSSNNYLGLAGSEQAKEAAVQAIKTYGLGSGSTRLLVGTLDIQLSLEKQLANFFGFEDAITFSSGYLANVGVIRMLVDPFPYFQIFRDESGLILSDELNHASIIDSVRLAKSPRERYPHSDMAALEKLLITNRTTRKLIITDGVFSMDGDLAKLKEITALAEAHDALVMVDDSHGIGVLGPRGEGTAHHLGAQSRTDVIMGSFTKAFGSIGGFIVASKTITDYLRITARSYIFSDPIPPALVAGLMVQTELVANGTALREKALANAQHLRFELKALGFSVLGDDTTIVPLLIGNEKKAIRFSEALTENLILAPCIRRPAVAEGRERIRFSVTALHTLDDITKLLEVCALIGKRLKMI